MANTHLLPASESQRQTEGIWLPRRAPHWPGLRFVLVAAILGVLGLHVFPDASSTMNHWLPFKSHSGRAQSNANQAPWEMELFQGRRMRVIDFTLPPNRTVELLHPRPCVRWQAGDAIQDLEIDGVKTENQVHDKQVFFAPAGQLWSLRNKGSQEYRQIVFEFLDPKPQRTDAQLKVLLDAAIFPTDVGTKLLFENEWCRVWDFSFAPGEGDAAKIHQHVMDYVFLYVGKGHPHKLIGTHPDGSIAFESEAYDGAVQWNDIPNGGFKKDGKTLLVKARHGGYNGNEYQFTEYLVELK